MKTAISSLTLALAAVIGTTASEADASGKSGSGPRSSMHVSGNFKSFSSHGRNYSFFCYPRSYCSWSRYCWFPSYGCYGYYCPTQCCWFYNAAPLQCYVPVSYISTFAPVQDANLNTNTNVNTNVNINGGSVAALPPGATELPAGTVPPQPAVR
jgi:hypothetical protein